MKRLLAIAIALAVSGGQAPRLSGQAGAPVLHEQETTTTADPPKKDVVELSKEAKAKRKKSTTKVITNKDVKKAKGKLIVISGPDAKTDPKAVKTETAPAATSDELYRARTDLRETVKVAEKKVAELERATDDLEHQYYASNDPHYRDDVLQKRFTQTKRQLDDARQQLADARDALQKLDQPKP
jgi:hypothetical protein